MGGVGGGESIQHRGWPSHLHLHRLRRVEEADLLPRAPHLPGQRGGATHGQDIGTRSNPQVSGAGDDITLVIEDIRVVRVVGILAEKFFSLKILIAGSVLLLGEPQPLPGDLVKMTFSKGALAVHVLVKTYLILREDEGGRQTVAPSPPQPRPGPRDSRGRLRLTKAQQRACNQNLKMEEFFSKYADDPDYAYIFDYKRDVVTCTTHLRIATRPYVLAMSGSTSLARQVRSSGEDVGFLYPPEPVEVEMRGPTPVLDCLTPTDTSNFFPLPPLLDPLDGVDNVDIAAAAMIRANNDTNRQVLAGYHQKMKEKYERFYKNVSKSSLDLDNNLTLGSELIGHVDGVLCDLARQKLLSIFKGRARGSILIVGPEKNNHLF